MLKFVKIILYFSILIHRINSLKLKDICEENRIHMCCPYDIRNNFV